MALPPVRPIFLHFLGGELEPLIGRELDSREVAGALQTLALASTAPLYCPVSSLWETQELDNPTLRLVERLMTTGILHTVGYTGTIDEFIESRKLLYAHDRERYPAYFDGRRLRLLQRLTATDQKPVNTTAALLNALGAWVLGGKTAKRAGTPTTASYDNAIRKAVASALQQRGPEALTYTYFRRFLEAHQLPVKAAEASVREQIYLAYTAHYQEYGNADVPTGFPGLSRYEPILADDFPLHDIPILQDLLKATGLWFLPGQGSAGIGEAWETFGQLRGWELHARVATQMRTIIDAALCTISERDRSSHFALRQQLRVALRSQLPASASSREIAMVTRLELAESILDNVIRRMSEDLRMRHAIELNAVQLDRSCDVLLLTATEVETRELLAAFRLYMGGALRKVFIGATTCFDLGVIRGARVFLAQSGMGSSGPRGSAVTAFESITTLKPSSIFLVGICFGTDPTRQQMGDVLVSRKILEYEAARVTSEPNGRMTLIPRGDIVSASPKLLDRCYAASVDWTGTRVTFGMILSGEKLIDHIGFRDSIRRIGGGEAVGGEMEGAGLYASSQRMKVDWVIVKAISDWADGKKRELGEKAQRQAARNAARFVRHVVTQGGLI